MLWIFYGHFVVIWYLSPGLVHCVKKSLATLAETEILEINFLPALRFSLSPSLFLSV
jgi:hypothetical protein